MCNSIDVYEINIIIAAVCVCVSHLRTLRMLHIFTHAVQRPKEDAHHQNEWFVGNNSIC